VLLKALRPTTNKSLTDAYSVRSGFAKARTMHVSIDRFRLDAVRRWFLCALHQRERKRKDHRAAVEGHRAADAPWPIDRLTAPNRLTAQRASAAFAGSA
jgi:hypothetical protein